MDKQTPEFESRLRRPFWLKGVNQIWSWTYPLGSRIRLDKDSVIRIARKRAGLTDLGQDFWDEPLERLIRSIKEEACLNPVGLFISRERLVNLLINRLRAEHCFSENPEILEQPLYPVWLISGLQRTGTTKLQRLLAADPDNRSLLSWEALNPAPVAKSPDPRIKMARTSEKALKFLSPGFFAIHPVEHNAPEEDVLLLDVSFMSTTAEATMHVPSYASWLEKADQSPAYDYSVKLLKLLQWQRPAKRWILKSPHHLEFLEVISRKYDQVQVLWTHRDVKECIPSFLSMLAFSRHIFSDQVSIADIKEHWLRKFGFMLSNAISFRDSRDNSKYFTDISYRDFIKDPLTTLEKIYSPNELSEDLRAKFQIANDTNPPNKYGAHRYQMEDFGLEAQDLEYQDYSDFLARIYLKN